MGYEDAAEGHRRGAQKIDELLEWCAELRIPVVTLWLLSPENLERDPDELAALLEIIEEKVSALARDERWHVRALGTLELLPDGTRQILEDASDASSGREGLLLNVAVGYGGRPDNLQRLKLHSYRFVTALNAPIGVAEKLRVWMYLLRRVAWLRHRAIRKLGRLATGRR